ncbi:tat pathway signal sequence [Janthinobacterium sp. B9-8]|nr:tat pathway signal sequence [Janthinobacterium sp. B9-8]
MKTATFGKHPKQQRISPPTQGNRPSVFLSKYLCTGLILLCTTSHAAEPVLNPAQTQAFRGWFVRIVNEQLRQGPNPRWQHRDCAGLVRFAVAEALQKHDAAWLQSNGISRTGLPPEVDLSPASRDALRHNWKQSDGKRAAYVPTFGLVQNNARLIGKDINQAEAGDLLFFDQGDDQHVMVWTGRYIAYHTGTSHPKDSGLRAVRIDQLMQWKDTRWQPRNDNPNFIGIYRLAFLPSAS